MLLEEVCPTCLGPVVTDGAVKKCVFCGIPQAVAKKFKRGTREGDAAYQREYRRKYPEKARSYVTAYKLRKKAIIADTGDELTCPSCDVRPKRLRTANPNRTRPPKSVTAAYMRTYYRDNPVQFAKHRELTKARLLRQRREAIEQR